MGKHNNIQVGFILLLLLVPTFVFAQQNVSDKNLKELIINEFNNYQPIISFYGLSVDSILFSDNLASNVDIDSKYPVININEIGKYIKSQQDSDFVKMFINYVIAHELSHKMQLRLYGRDVILRSKGEGRIFVECQADIMSALFMIMASQTPNSYKSRELEKRTFAEGQMASLKSMRFVFEQIIKMDNSNVHVATHPSHSERLMSLNRGVLAGGAYFNRRLRPSVFLSQSKIDSINRHYLGYYRALGIEMKDSIDLFGWTAYDAVRIIHQTNSKARNLILFNKKIEWNPDANNPIVKYSFDATNRNNRAIRFAGIVYTELYPKNDSEKVLNIIPVDGQAFDYVIEPGQTVTVSGTLQWEAPYGSMPYIRMPGDQRALYSVYDLKDPMHDSYDADNFDFDFNEWDNETLENILDLINYVVSIKKRLFDFTKGVGNSAANSLSTLPQFPIYYEPIFKSGEQNDQYIYYIEDSSKCIYSFIASSSQDSSVTNDRFNKIILAIQSSLRQFKSQDIDASKGVQSVSFLDGENKTAITITIFFQQVTGKYSIGIQIHE